MSTTTARKHARAGVAGKFLQFLVLKAQAATAVKRADEIKVELMAFAEASGIEDEKNHKVHTLASPVEAGGTEFTGFMRQRKITESFDDATAEKILVKKNLLAEAQTTVTYIDQDKVMRLYADDKITQRELDKMITKKESFAFVPVKA